MKTTVDTRLRLTAHAAKRANRQTKMAAVKARSKQSDDSNAGKRMVDCNHRPKATTHQNKWPNNGQKHPKTKREKNDDQESWRQILG